MKKPTTTTRRPFPAPSHHDRPQVRQATDQELRTVTGGDGRSYVTGYFQMDLDGISVG